MSSKATGNTIEVKGLVKRYGRFEAVKGVSFQVRQGEIIGFLGPNGAGKSTVMKVLTSFMSATSGEVRVAGHDVYREALAVRRKVGYQPENVPLYREMVVYDYLLFMAKMRGVPRARRQQRIEYVAHTCGLGGVMAKLVGELSKGYRQRVGLAQALIHDPSVLILDEPMSGLDPNQIIEIRDLIKDIGREKTVIFSSHILQEIEKICDRILILDEGKIVADGTLSELTSLLEGRRRYQLTIAVGDGVDETSVKAKLEGVAKRVEVVPRAASDALTYRLTGGPEDLRPALFGLVSEAGWPLLQLSELAMTLEDIFRALTGREASPTRSKRTTTDNSTPQRATSGQPSPKEAGEAAPDAAVDAS